MDMKATARFVLQAGRRRRCVCNRSTFNRVRGESGARFHHRRGDRSLTGSLYLLCFRLHAIINMDTFSLTSHSNRKIKGLETERSHLNTFKQSLREAGWFGGHVHRPPSRSRTGVSDDACCGLQRDGLDKGREGIGEHFCEFGVNEETFSPL